MFFIIPHLSSAISSTCELCDELCESSERRGCVALAVRGVTGKNASRLNCCVVEAIETMRDAAKRQACTALPCLGKAEQQNRSPKECSLTPPNACQQSLRGPDTRWTR